MTATVAAALGAALLLTGCSVKVNVDGHETGVQVQGPDIHISVPQEPGNPGTVPVDVPLPDGVRQLDVTIGHSVGEVRIDGRGSAALSGEVGYWRNAPAVTTSQSDDRLIVNIPSEHANNVNGHVPDTELHLNDRIPVRLTVNAGVGAMRLDLTRVQVNNVTIHAGVGGTDLTVPADRNVRVRFKAGVGGHNLEAAGFHRSGDVWLSPNFSDKNTLEVNMEAGVGGFSIHRR